MVFFSFNGKIKASPPPLMTWRCMQMMKSVKVRPYKRFRLGRLEFVSGHIRSLPTK